MSLSSGTVFSSVCSEGRIGQAESSFGSSFAPIRCITSVSGEEKAMMGGRSWDDWLEEYQKAHEHPVNRLTHTFGIPMIALAIILLPVGFFVKYVWLAAAI